MFRKAESKVLDETDCHSLLRREHQHLIKDDEFCVSIALDWSHKGRSNGGIRRETMWSLMRVLHDRRQAAAWLCKEKSTRNPKAPVVGLAQTELSLLFVDTDMPGLGALGPIIKAVITEQLEIIRRATLMAKAQEEVAARRSTRRAEERKNKKSKSKKVDEKKQIEDEKKQSKDHEMKDLVQLADDGVDAMFHHVPGRMNPCAFDFDCAHCGVEIANCYFRCMVSER
jgi:hypothetical protein